MTRDEELMFIMKRDYVQQAIHQEEFTTQLMAELCETV